MGDVDHISRFCRVYYKLPTTSRKRWGSAKWINNAVGEWIISNVATARDPIYPAYSLGNILKYSPVEGQSNDISTEELALHFL